MHPECPPRFKPSPRACGETMSGSFVRCASSAPQRRATAIKLLRLLALLVAVNGGAATAQTSRDQCSDEARRIVGQHLGVDEFVPQNKSGNIVAEACRPWPYNRNLLLAVFAFDAGVELQKTLAVAVIDGNAKRVVRSHQHTIDEDVLMAVGPSSLHLDTARYQLSKDVRAFGVRFTSAGRGPSCADGAAWDELTLYAPDNKQLRPVLTMNTKYQRALQGCIGTPTGNDVMEFTTVTLSVEDSSTHGYADLRVTESIVSESEVLNPGSDVGNNKQVKSYLIHYDGKQYTGLDR